MIKFLAKKIDVFNGMLLIEIPPNTSLELIGKAQSNGKPLSVQIDTPKQKRSCRANSYCWVLCQMIAEELSKNGPLIKREEVYKKNIKDLFLPRFNDVPADDVDWWIEEWSNRGIGWMAERVGPTKDGKYKLAFWVGSSRFDTEQMSRLIEGLKQDAEELGLNVLSESDIALMLQYWKPE